MNIDEFVEWLRTAMASLEGARTEGGLTAEQENELNVRAGLIDIAWRALHRLHHLQTAQGVREIEYPAGTGSREMKMRELLARIPLAIQAAERGDVWEAMLHAIVVGARYDIDQQAGDIVELRRAFERDYPLAQKYRPIRRGQVHRGKSRRKINDDPNADAVLLQMDERLKRERPDLRAHERHEVMGSHYKPPVKGRTIRARLTEIRRKTTPGK